MKFCFKLCHSAALTLTFHKSNKYNICCLLIFFPFRSSPLASPSTDANPVSGHHWWFKRLSCTCQMHQLLVPYFQLERPAAPDPPPLNPLTHSCLLTNRGDGRLSPLVFSGNFYGSSVCVDTHRNTVGVFGM